MDFPVEPLPQQGLGAVGNGGDIEIITNSLEVTNGAALTASTLGEGNAGGVKIKATDTVRFDGSVAFSTVEAGALGNGSNIEIITDSLELTNGALLNSTTLGEGDAGDVKIIASDTVRFDRGSIVSAVGTEAVGDGGNIEITTGSLEMTNGAQLFASSVGEGNAGDIKIIATDTVRLDGLSSNRLPTGVSSSVGAEAVGDGGDIEISTSSLDLTGALLSAVTLGKGNAGNVTINASDTVRFDVSVAFSSVEAGAVGDGGDFEINTSSLEVINGAQLSASTSGKGNAGNIRIHATDSVRFDRFSRASSSVEAGAMGDGGNIEITTSSLEVTNGAQLSASTFGEGNAGDVKINATDSVRFDSLSTVFSQVEEGAVGDGGDIEITTGSLDFTNFSILTASTFGEGNAGDVTINATDTVRFDGLGVALSSVAPGAVGNGGDIEINAGSLSLTDAFISSESLGTGTAGNITITTRQNLETNRSNISATTLSGDGGNITLQVGDLLLMRDNSKISTTAGVAGTGGDGGDITIDADFVIGVPRENSDITANAFNGRGGNITITTQGIFGLQFRDRLTPLSDITASSEFGLDGEFQLNLLSPIDVSQGLVDLPSNLVDATKLIDRRCTPRDPFRQSSFVITGRGGIPQNPTEILDADAIVSNWVTLDSEEESGNQIDTDTNPTSTTPQRIIEAQGIVRTPDGQLYLAAEVPTVTPHGEWIPAVDCYNFRN